jgi:Putative Flp pilus-assembly TadE/G-like
MRARRHAVRSEQGAVFVQVGISLFVLMAFNVFVLDYGMMWVGRGQAQNAADAGALAGATARAYDYRIIGNAGVIEAAQKVVDANLIWQTAGAREVLPSDVSCPSVAPDCVRVNVHRNGTLGSTPLPTLFGPILGITGQGVRATSMAIVGPVNTTTCLKPWALPDEWREFGSSVELDQLDSTTTFHRWNPGGVLSPNPDSYTAPTSAQATTATNFSTDYGDIVQFALNYPITDPIRRGMMLPLALPGPNNHQQNMTGCNGQPIVIGQRLSIDATLDPATAEASAQLSYASDASADWSFDFGIGAGYVERSCAPGCAPISPRIWTVALYDPSDFERNRSSGWPDCGGTPCVLVANIAGFFIDYLDAASPNGRHGHFVRYPGTLTAAQPSIIEDGSWLVAPRLIR